ncbi:MAG: hypothetical protein ACE5GJ_07530 [Gemmatimonadota bacterium]
MRGWWTAVAVLLAVPATVSAEDGTRASVRHAAAPIPAFARLYGTACSTCHTAAPKLNVLGEAFRLAGYRMPDSELLVRRDGPVPLGADPWKDAWPRSIWPSELPGIAPLALRIQSDVRVRSRSEGAGAVEYEFPHEIYLLAGAPLGEHASAFLEVEWEPEEELHVVQAKVGYRDPVPGLPAGALNLWVGRLNPFLLTFTDRQIDRAGIVGFGWQDFRLDAVGMEEPDGTVRRAGNGVRLGGGHQSVELNGVLGGRVHYALGLARGSASVNGADNGSKDPYYRFRVKLGGLDLNGRYGAGQGPVPGTGGQLLDRALIVEHFGYFGHEETPDAPQGAHRAWGLAVRALHGPLDVGVGWVRRDYQEPWGLAGGELHADFLFGKAEYLLYPWLMASLKYDRADLDADALPLQPGARLLPSARRRLTPGVVALVRQNLRVATELILYLGGDAARLGVGGVRHAFLLRLDLSF